MCRYSWELDFVPLVRTLLEYLVRKNGSDPQLREGCCYFTTLDCVEKRTVNCECLPFCVIASSIVDVCLQLKVISWKCLISWIVSSIVSCKHGYKAGIKP